MLKGAKTGKRAGFTVVELIAVVAIIGILAAVSIVGYGNWRSSLNKSAVKNDLKAAAARYESERNATSGSGLGYPSWTAMPADFSGSANVVVTPFAGQAPTAFCLDGTYTTDSSIQFYIDNLVEPEPQAGTCATRSAASVVPSQVTGVSFTTTSSVIQVAWTAATPNAASKYDVQCAQDPAFITGLLTTQVSGGSTVTAGISGGQASTAYYCRVRGISDAGSGLWSALATGRTP